MTAFVLDVEMGVLKRILDKERVLLVNKVFFSRIYGSPMLTNSSLLNGQVVANPEIMPVTNPVFLFVEEVEEHFRAFLGLNEDEAPRQKVEGHWSGTCEALCA